MLVFSCDCLFICLCCLFATSRRSVVRQQWRPGAKDRQSKQKLEIRRKKLKNSEQIYTGNKSKCRQSFWTYSLMSFTFHAYVQWMQTLRTWLVLLTISCSPGVMYMGSIGYTRFCLAALLILYTCLNKNYSLLNLMLKLCWTFGHYGDGDVGCLRASWWWWWQGERVLLVVRFAGRTRLCSP